MLYVTTRNRKDTFPPEQALKQSRAGDGGFYIPASAPVFSMRDITELKFIPFNQCVANILNELFGCKLTAWDLDFCIGRYPVRIRELGGHVVVAETWHNPDWNFSGMAKRITRILDGTERGWTEIAIRIAVLFGIYGQVLRHGLLNAGEAMDISVMAGDMLATVSAWYARKWGLPIGNIVCCCNENNALWNLLCQGQMRTDAVSIPTFLPQADVAVPDALEHLIAACGGNMELEAWLECRRIGRVYEPEDKTLARLRDGLFVSVVSSDRIRHTIPNVYATHNYLPAPSTALGYAGLMDYRVKKGRLFFSAILADNSPRMAETIVAEAMGMEEAKLREIL